MISLQRCLLDPKEKDTYLHSYDDIHFFLVMSILMQCQQKCALIPHATYSFFLSFFKKKLSLGVATLNIMVQRLRGELSRTESQCWDGKGLHQLIPY